MAFTQAAMPWHGAYFLGMALLFVLFIIQWKRAQVDDAVHGKLAHPSFLKWLLWESRNSHLNWFWFAIFCINIVRLIITIIFGYAPPIE